MKKYSKYLWILLVLILIPVLTCFIPIKANALIPNVEKQVASELGIKIHIEELILRVGPFVKVKAPTMHLMYEDGQKFGQFDNVKFYIPWLSIIKKEPQIHTMYANSLIIRTYSTDKYLDELLSRIAKRDLSEQPNIHIKDYNISYTDNLIQEKYSLTGKNLNIDKILSYKNFNFKALGNFSINDKKYITYDLALSPKFDMPENVDMSILKDTIEKIKSLDFHADILSDLKLYKNKENLIQGSGFFNIDNISILKANNKTPDSFIYLTLWGDKCSLLSNIYTNENKKIYIEGIINNSKKPNVDLKVKADDILLENLYEKLYVLTDFTKFKAIENIKGILSANFTIKGDLKKIKSTGYLKIKNAQLEAGNVKIKNINSDIDFANNTINIVNTIGYVNNAPIILKGIINKTVNLELLMSNVSLSGLCPRTSGIKSGTISMSANIGGTVDNIVHNESIKIEKFKIQKPNTDLSIESFKFDTNQNNIAHVYNVICKLNNIEPIKIPSVKFLVEKDEIKLTDTNIYMPNSKVTANGKITNYNNLNNAAFMILLNGFINSKDIAYIKTISSRYPINATISGNKNILNILSQVMFEKTDIFDEPMVLNSLLKLENNSLKIEDVNISTLDIKNTKGTKKISVSGAITDLKSFVIKDLRFYIPQPVGIHWNDSFAQIKGDFFINGNISKPEIIGQINIKNLFNQLMQLSSSNATVDFEKDTISINAPNVKIADTVASFNGNLINNFTNGIHFKNMNIKSKFLNTDTVLMYKDTPFKNNFPIIIDNGKLYSERMQVGIYDSVLYLTAFTSDFNLLNETLQLKNITAEGYNGKLIGSLNYNIKDDNFAVSTMIRNASASPFFDIISKRNDAISGTMDCDCDLTGNLIIKNSLDGNVKFIVHNGRMSTLGKLEHLIYAQNVLADNMLRTSLSVVTKAITLKDTGLFKYLKGDIVINKGIADIKMLQTQGPLMALFIKGKYNTVNNNAQLVVLGRISDEIISGLGAFADFSIQKLKVMLTGEDTKYNINIEDFNKIPQLNVKNTKEFRSIINGNIDKPSSVLMFNWISYTQKSLKQNDIPPINGKVPAFVDNLPY